MSNIVNIENTWEDTLNELEMVINSLVFTIYGIDDDYRYITDKQHKKDLLNHMKNTIQKLKDLKNILKEETWLHNI